MALDGSKKGFGFDVEDRFKKVTGTSEHKHDDVSTHTHHHTHTPKVRERKTARIQILTYPTIIEKLDTYARNHGLSRAEAFERAVTEFLENNT